MTLSIYQMTMRNVLHYRASDEPTFLSCYIINYWLNFDSGTILFLVYMGTVLVLTVPLKIAF